MNTKPIPIIITLAGSGINAVISILQGVDFATFVLRLLISVCVFYTVGIVVGVLCIQAFGVPKKPEKGEEKEGAELKKEGNDERDSENIEEESINTDSADNTEGAADSGAEDEAPAFESE